jgi:hypothetical protein
MVQDASRGVEDQKTQTLRFGGEQLGRLQQPTIDMFCRAVPTTAP